MFELKENNIIKEKISIKFKNIKMYKYKIILEN